MCQELHQNVCLVNVVQENKIHLHIRLTILICFVSVFPISGNTCVICFNNDVIFIARNQRGTYLFTRL